MKSIKVITVVALVLMVVGLALGTGCGGRGPAGVGIASVVDNHNGTFTLQFTNGTSFTTSNLTGPKGDTGATGDTGPKGDTGTTGVGIQSIVNNGNGTFTLHLTNGSSFTTDNLTGPQGIQGLPGFGWGNPVSHGPIIISVPGDGWSKTQTVSLNPGDRVEFSFTIGTLSGWVSYYAHDPDYNIILTGNGGATASSGHGAFIAAESGQYDIYFQVSGILGATVTLNYTVYPVYVP